MNIYSVNSKNKASIHQQFDEMTGTEYFEVEIQQETRDGMETKKYCFQPDEFIHILSTAANEYEMMNEINDAYEMEHLFELSGEPEDNRRDWCERI